MRIQSLLISTFFFFLIPVIAFSQSGAKWATGGNSTGAGDFMGTTNNQPLFFKVNNVQRASISTAGILQVNSLAGTGNGFTTLDASGNLQRTNFNGNSTMFLGGDGTFHTFSSAGGWTLNGNNLVNTNSGFIGIGTASPQYLLDVSGDARVNGTLYAMGLVLATKMQADTVKGTNMISVNNNLNLSGGLLNEMYAYNGDVRIQSRAGYNGNTIFNAGTNGNVGVGIYTPQYKLDVNGDARLNGRTHVYRIVPLAGDSILRFGDSTVTLNTSANLISATPNFNIKGIGIGFGNNRPFGSGSVTIGTKIWANPAAFSSVVIGEGITSTNQAMICAIPHSLMIGFNSNIPTLFVGQANGAGTTGKVGIATTNPQYDLDVNGTINATQILQNGQPLGQWTSNGTDIFFDQNSITGGSVGIGVAGSSSFFLCPTCSSGKYLLAVDGGIRAKALKVEPLWSDYVFEPGYTLIPLDTVANYIKLNGHLPGVQSAADVKTNGIDVGDTEAMLLAKIEELTLYMLQLQQQNAAMQKEIDALKK